MPEQGLGALYVYDKAKGNNKITDNIDVEELGFGRGYEMSRDGKTIVAITENGALDNLIIKYADDPMMTIAHVYSYELSYDGSTVYYLEDSGIEEDYTLYKVTQNGVSIEIGQHVSQISAVSETGDSVTYLTAAGGLEWQTEDGVESIQIAVRPEIFMDTNIGVDRENKQVGIRGDELYFIAKDKNLYMKKFGQDPKVLDENVRDFILKH